MRSLPLYIISAIILIGIYSCNKDKKRIPHSISWAGVQEVGNTIAFSSDVPKAHAFLWSFGDSTTSTDKEPHHEYLKAGRYAVSLVANGDTGSSVRDTIEIGPGHMEKIAGNRLWHHTYTSVQPWPPYSTLHTMPDVTFTIEYIDVMRIAVRGDTLLWFSSTDSVISFLKSRHPLDKDWYLKYNYYTGAINYSISTHISAAAGDDNDRYYTP